MALFFKVGQGLSPNKYVFTKELNKNDLALIYYLYCCI